MAVIIPADAGVAAGRIGSLTVTSAQSLAGAVLEYQTTVAPALILQGTTGFTPNDYDTRILFPVVKKTLAGRSTGLQVMNVGDTDVQVVVTYRGAGPEVGAGSGCKASAGVPFVENAVTLKAKQSTTFLNSALLPDNCLASAEAVATGANVVGIVGVVNESFLPCTAGCTQRSTTYAAFPAKKATTKVVAPVFKQDFGNKRSGLSVQNISNATATATVTFQVGANSFTYNNLTIPAQSSALLLDVSGNAAGFPTANWASSTRLPNATLSAVTITANQPIIALVNEAPLAGSGLVQDNINYEAFNVAP